MPDLGWYVNGIIADSALSALDGRLGRLYHEKIALLSPQGGKLLQDSERSWLHFVGIVCPLHAPDERRWASRKQCLANLYNSRIEKLESAAQKVGPYIFNRIDLYAASPSEDDTGSVEGFYVKHVSYPQIDNVNSPEVRAWNQASVHELSTDGACDSDDFDVDYEIGLASARLISVRWTDSTYCHGNAHGAGDVKSANSVFAPGLRPLVADDLFGHGQAWQAELKKHFWEALIRTGWSPPDNQPGVKQELEEDAVQPDRWFLTVDGLQVAFDSYEGGCFACTPQPVTLSWSELGPLLSKNAVAP